MLKIQPIIRGRTFGPYGGNGGYPFTAQPPRFDCYLAWISGQSNLRYKKPYTLSYLIKNQQYVIFFFSLDGISFHWRCPSKTFAPIQDSVKENLLIEETVYKNSASIQISLQGNQIIYWIAIILLVLSHN